MVRQTSGKAICMVRPFYPPEQTQQCKLLDVRGANKKTGLLLTPTVSEEALGAEITIPPPGNPRSAAHSDTGFAEAGKILRGEVYSVILDFDPLRDMHSQE